MQWLQGLRRFWLPSQYALVWLMMIFSAMLAARITWQWLEPIPTVSAPTITPNIDGKNQGLDARQLAQGLASKELFGDFVVQPTRQPVVVEQPVIAPETKLNLSLQAVLSQSNQGRGFAVIAQRMSEGKVFGIGDDVFGQATLSAVFSDRVLLSRNGREEVLRYEKSNSGAMLEPLQAPQVALTEASNQGFNNSFEQAQRLVNQGADSVNQVQEVVMVIQQMMMIEPEVLLDEVGLEVTSLGYRVSPQAQTLRMIGLRPGDVVTSVNDNPVGNISQDQILLSQLLQTGGELKLQVQRGSRSFTIFQSIPSF